MNFSQQIIIIREIDIPEALIKLRSDGFVHVHYKKNITVNSEIQNEMREIFSEIRNGKKSHFIFSSDSGVSFTKDVLQDSLGAEGETAIASYALIASNPAARMIANVYLKINKPRISHKLFSNIDEAVQWLTAQEKKLINNPIIDEN